MEAAVVGVSALEISEGGSEGGQIRIRSVDAH